MFVKQSDSQLQKRVNQLESELASCREEFQKQLSQKDAKHDEEVNLLKADMLVAIQVARSGTTSPNGANQPDSQTVTNTITRAGVKLSLEVCYICFIVFICYLAVRNEKEEKLGDTVTVYNGHPELG